jgi:hypothetical protein
MLTHLWHTVCYLALTLGIRSDEGMSRWLFTEEPGLLDEAVKAVVLEGTPWGQSYRCKFIYDIKYVNWPSVLGQMDLDKIQEKRTYSDRKVKESSL